MLRTTARSSALIALLVVTVLGGAACGGSSSDSSGSTTSTATKTSSATDAGADDAATAATVALADLGAGWTEYRKAGGFTPISGACNLKFGTPVQTSDRGYGGPMLRDSTEQTFVYSSAFVFTTEAEAKAFVAARETDAFKQCKAAEDDAAQKKRDATTFVRLSSAAAPSLGGQLESAYQEDAGGKNADGSEVVNGGYARYTFRSGRVVSIVSMDTSLPNEAAARTALGERISGWLTTASSAIKTRVDVLDL